MASTHFLNVDLDIYSKRDLQPLVKSLGRKVRVLHVGRESRRYSAHLEISGMAKTADATVRVFCALIEKLPESERAIWNDAANRSFSIGIQAGDRPHPLDFGLRAETVRRVAQIGAEIVLTVYPAEP